MSTEVAEVEEVDPMDIVEDLAETALDVMRIVADGQIDPSEIVEIVSAALEFIREIPLKREPPALLKAAKLHEAKAHRLQRRGHERASARHTRKAKALREKAAETD